MVDRIHHGSRGSGENTNGTDSYSWALNNELPVMTPWKTVSPINTPTWSMERNPYFWAVDTAGNQLPYIDRITMTLAETKSGATLTMAWADKAYAIDLKPAK